MQRPNEPLLRGSAVSGTARWSEPARGTGQATAIGEPCDLCGGATLEIKCKIICRNCGYTRDCSDP